MMNTNTTKTANAAKTTSAAKKANKVNLVTKNAAHRQQETAYMVYMIIGSYFHKCTCRSRALEENLFLYYKEMKVNKQEQREEQIIRVIEKVLKPIQGNLERMNAEVYIGKKDNLYSLSFYTGFELVTVTVDRQGRYKISFDGDELAA